MGCDFEMKNKGSASYTILDYVRELEVCTASNLHRKQSALYTGAGQII